MRIQNQPAVIMSALSFILLIIFTLNSCDPPAVYKSKRIYVTIAAKNEVTVIDEKKQEIISHIPIGAGPAIILATPDGSKLYTANWGDNTVSAIDTKTEKVTTIPMTGRPYVIAMSPDGKKVYAGLYSNEIAVIKTADNTIIKSLPTPELPASLFVSPDGKILYVAITTAVPGTIRAISAETGEMIHEPITIGTAPGWITMSPDGAKVYALNFYSDDVSVVDTEKWVVEAVINTGKGSKGIIGAVSPDNKTLYVTNLGTANLMAIDTQTNAIAQTIPMGGRPVGVSLNKSGSRIYVTDYGPESLDTEPSNTFLYTGVYTGTHDGRVNILSADTKKVIGKITVGPGPSSVAAASVWTYRKEASDSGQTAE